MKDAKQFWDGCAQKYVQRPIKDTLTYQKKLALSRRYFRADSQILEFGCGSGGTALAHAPFVQSVIATDLSDNMIEIAQHNALKAGVQNIHFQQGTLDSIQALDGGFDAVLGLNVLHLLEDVDGAVSHAHRLLSPGGVFISSTSLLGEVSFVFRWLIALMQRLGFAPYVKSMTRDQLVSMLEQAGFQIEHELRVSQESVFIVARKGIADKP